MSAEKVYQILSNEQQQQQCKQPRGGGQNQGQGNGSGKPRPGKGQSPPQGGKGSPQAKPGKTQPLPGVGDKLPKRADGSRKLGEMEKPGNSPEEQEQAKQDANSWKNTLIQSAMLAKGQGFVPSGMQRLVDSLVSPQVPWTELVRNFLREKCHDDWDWMTPDQLFEGSGFLLPSLNSERLGTMVFATDTSGSIDNDTLRQFQSEKQYCLDEMKPTRLVDIYCDAAIHKQAEYRPGDQIDLDAPGGGGTDFRPVFDLCNEMMPNPKCVVYLTDLAGTFPDEPPPYEVLWVTWDPTATAPFGQVIRVL